MIVVYDKEGYTETAVLLVLPREVEALKAALEIAQHCDDPELGIIIDSLIIDFAESQR